MPVISLHVTERVRRRLRKESMAWHPREFFCALLGCKDGDATIVSDIWIPEDLDDHTTINAVDCQDEWSVPANEYAEERDLKVVGSHHSHPFLYSEPGIRGEFINNAEPVPSYTDWHSGAWDNICGITSVVQRKDGSLRTMTRFYGPITTVQMIKRAA